MKGIKREFKTANIYKACKNLYPLKSTTKDKEKPKLTS